MVIFAADLIPSKQTKVTWIDIIPALFFLALGLQVLFYLVFFSPLAFYKPPALEEQPSAWPGVSIVVAAWNELFNLGELILLLEAQDYPDLEIVLVDDRSSDGTYDFLLSELAAFPRTTFVHIDSLPDHFTAKKYAVTMGIKKASKDIILVTDADCRPVSDQWVKQMVLHMGEKDLTLGFSPYYGFNGLLNAFIRYETFQTAVQYMGFALNGFPFMGVGRNLMYRKSLFWEKNGFASHYALLSGDDDLFVNESATSQNTAVCLSPETHVYSMPKLTYTDWYNQKLRHLSVGKRYKFRDQILLGALWISQILTWLLWIPAMLTEASWFEVPEWSRIPSDWSAAQPWLSSPWVPNWVRLILGIGLGWVFLKWLWLAQMNRQLGKTLNPWKLVGYDLLYSAYLLIFGIITLISNPKKLKWR